MDLHTPQKHHFSPPYHSPLFLIELSSYKTVQNIINRWSVVNIYNNYEKFDKKMVVGIYDLL